MRLPLAHSENVAMRTDCGYCLLFKFDIVLYNKVVNMERFKQWLIDIGDTVYYTKLSHELRDAETVLDVGCGARSPIAKVKKSFRSVGLDIFKRSIEQSRRAHIHDDYVVGDVVKLSSYIKEKSFDAVIALDLIEHLPKKDGIAMLKQMETIARKKVILLTPNGYINQEPYEGNPYQIHKSGWTTEDFAARGYILRGMRGLKWLRGEYATIKFKPWIFWSAVSVLSEFIVYFFPRYANQLFAVKHTEQ